MDYTEAPLIVEITQMAYSQTEALAAVQKLVDHFNYKYSCQYQVDKIWEIKRKFDLTVKGQKVEHYQIELTKAGEKSNWDHMKNEYDFIQAHYIHKELATEG
jgi:hypothetical protein